MKKIVIDSIRRHIKLANLLLKAAPAVQTAAGMLVDTIRTGGTVFLCGNGGSAADCQHIAAELVGKFTRKRKAFRAVALTTDTSVLTSLGNDLGCREIFKRQVEGLVRKGDLLIGISTSGNSVNVHRALREARRLGAKTLGLLGNAGGSRPSLKLSGSRSPARSLRGRIKGECDFSIIIPSGNTANIQEMHILIGHILCDLVEIKGS